MTREISRRDFIRATALTAGLAAASTLTSRSSAAFGADADKTYRTTLHKAWIVGGIDAKQIEHLAALGVEGVETSAWDVEPEKAREGRKICEANGIKIHSVMRAWTNFNTDSADADVQTVNRALRAAAAYGASTILLVPCRTGVAGPAAWDFDIEFDPETCMVTKVVQGDNAPYADYIKAQNEATVASFKRVKESIPVAAYEGVTIGLENVWNGLWSTPEFFGAFVKAFDSVWVKTYFDLGNHVKFSPTERWLRALKGTICKLHIKDFKVDKLKGSGGDFVPIGKGSIDWKSVRDVIDEIDYNGFVSLESGGYSDEQHAKIFDNFFAGKDILSGVEE